MTHLSSITNHNLLPPTLVRTIHEAFDDAVNLIETRRGRFPAPEDKRLRAALARTIVDLARHGECDAERLRDEALKAVHIEE